jgi:hypothetical protein
MKMALIMITIHSETCLKIEPTSNTFYTSKGLDEHSDSSFNTKDEGSAWLWYYNLNK